jgi:hypothetical protein
MYLSQTESGFFIWLLNLTQTNLSQSQKKFGNKIRVLQKNKGNNFDNFWQMCVIYCTNQILNFAERRKHSENGHRKTEAAHTSFSNTVRLWNQKKKKEIYI